MRLNLGISLLTVASKVRDSKLNLQGYHMLRPVTPSHVTTGAALVAPWQKPGGVYVKSRHGQAG